jgi:hypothetical protein
VTDPTLDESLNHITSAVRLGALLRELRGKRTQQNVADHAKREHFYVHRPDLSAIERGRRLPTANELQGILRVCGRPDLFDHLDCIRQQLMMEPTVQAASNGQLEPTNYLPDAGSEIARETTLHLRSSKQGRTSHRKLFIAAFTTTAVAIFIVGFLASGREKNSTPPHVAEAILTQLDKQTAVTVLRSIPLCAEQLIPPQAEASFTVLAQGIGPADAERPDRLVELRAYHDPHYGWVVWTHLTKSTSSRDRLWLDWSYLSEPTDRNQWRQCGPNAINFGPDSFAVQAVDSTQRQRWFRACGQAPPEDRPIGSKHTSFCTSWVPGS